MVCVYKGLGSTNSYLVKHWLERNGIAAVVRGDLATLGGEIPMMEAWPSVWVRPADEARALESIRVFEGPQLVHPRWLCPACGEDNEPNFGSCWNCSSDQPGLEASEKP